jgi:molecular chaperone GrpE (heat shock protein)
LQRDLAATRIELQEARAALATERARIVALEQAQAAQVRDQVESHLEALFTALAAPLSQLRLQAALLEAGTAVAAADVMALARRCIGEIERAGLEPIGVTGEVIQFAPESAQPLTEGGRLTPGDRVRVRFVGYRYHGRVLRKALVEHEET